MLTTSECVRQVFQFNGRDTVSIKNFYAEDYSKVIRSCGDYTVDGGPRNVIIEGGPAQDGGVLYSIDTHYSETCKIIDSCQSNKKSGGRY